jgi:dihydroxy-acid dehydratase
MTVTGKSVRENVAKAECFKREVIRTPAEPLHPEGGTVVLYGNLAPDGAVIKQTAASPGLLQHRGKAYVFENYEQMRAQIDSMDLPVSKDTVLVMKNCGPKGAPGFPEWGHIPMPKVLLEQGVPDMVRISDARMSGTSFGTVVLHAAPESALGGALAIVQTGDEVQLDVAGRQIELCVPAQEIQRRLQSFTPAPPKFDRGYGRMFLEHVTQANLGCDFDFLRKV